MECRFKVSRKVVGSSNVSHHSPPVKVSSPHRPGSGKSAKRLVEETGGFVGKPMVKQVRTDHSVSQNRDPPVVMMPKVSPHPVALISTKRLVGETGNSTGEPGSSTQSSMVRSMNLNPCLEESHALLCRSSSFKSRLQHMGCS